MRIDRFRIETAIFFTAMLGFCTASTHWQWFRTLDLALYDSLIAAVPLPLRNDVLIVGIDEQSLASYGSWPWPRDLQARLIEEINHGSPRALLVDFVYGGESDPLADRALVSAAAKVDMLALPMIVDALATGRQLVEVMPFSELLAVTDVIGHVHVELDADAIARGVYLYQGIGDAHWPHLALAFAEHLGDLEPVLPDCPAAQEFSIQNHRCGFVYLSFSGPPGTYPEISASDVLAGRIDKTQLQGKIVFLGITTAAAPDVVTSPASGNDRPMSGIEFNANLFGSLTQLRTSSEPSLWILYLTSLLCVVVPVILLPHLKPKAMLVAAPSFATIPVFVSALGLLVAQVQLPLAAAVVTCLLSYPYWSWRRHEVAWQFVNAEMSRLELEKSRWVFAEPEHLVDEDATRLGDLLDAEAVWYDASPSIRHDRQIALPGDRGRWLVLSRTEPFTAEERALAEKLKPKFSTSPATSIKLPGEVLAAQIRKLQTAAREVRLGREVGLRGLAEMPNGIAVISLLNQVLFVNQACRELLNLPEQTTGMELTTMVHGLVPPLGSSWKEISQTVILTRQTVSFETQTSASTPVLVDAAPLAEPGEVPESWVITITDMTDVHIAERDREEALAFLSHDLRSPMLSVLALVRGAGETSLLNDIGRYAQKGLAVSEQFLQLSRVQAREQFETYELDLVSVLSNAIDQVYVTAQERASLVRFEPDSILEGVLEEGAWIQGNGELLERAFVNLLTNAIKYSPSGSLIDVVLTSGPRQFDVTVSDQGVGIPEEEVDHVFEPYFRSAEPALAEQRGSGLGLRFVKTVVERHGGSVSVQSRLGEGSRFTATLPRQGQLND